MKKTFAIGFAIVAMTLFSGCAAKSYIPLSESNRGKIYSSDFVILQIQKEVMAEVEKSNIAASMGGGLLPALVDAYIENSRATDAEELIQPIRNYLLDYKVEEEIQKELSPVLNNTPWFSLESLKLVQNWDETQMDQLLGSTHSEAVGLIMPSYKFDSDFAALKMQIEFLIYPASKTNKNLENQDREDPTPIYKTIVEHRYSLAFPADTAKENSKLWAESDGQSIKLALSQSIKEMVNTLNYDLQDPSKEKKE